MKAFKIVSFIFLICFITLYLMFLFYVPYGVHINQYSNQIESLVYKNTGLQIKMKGLKVKTAWNLSAGALVDRIDLNYSDGNKFAQINNFEIRVSLLPLIRKKVRINVIKADKLLMNLDTETNGKLVLEKYFSKSTKQELPCGLRFSTSMPIISVNKYRFSIINNFNDYSFKGNHLNISDFKLNDKIKVKTSGDLVLNQRKQVSYNVSVLSHIFPQSSSDKINSSNIIKILDDLYKYNLTANIVADLKTNNNNIDGKVDIDKISFTFGNKIYPESNLKLAFNGNKAKINASLHADKSSKAIVTGFLNTGKKKFVDLHVITDSMNIRDILLITKAMSRPFGLIDLKNIDAEGLFKADFNIKSDFKKVESRGYLKINNASIKDQLYKVVLNSINADIDFSNNSIRIKQANARLNNQPILIKGTVNQNAVANIEAFANNLNLKGVLFALGQMNFLKENAILNGSVNFKVALNGRLDKVKPKLSLNINNIFLKNNKLNANIKVSNIVVYTNLEEKSQHKVLVINLKVTGNGLSTISCPKLNLIFNEQKANIIPTYLYIDNIKTNLNGEISDLSTKPHISFININIPSLTTVPIKGYNSSKIILKGGLTLSGDISNPNIKGGFNIPLISIPTNSLVLKNTVLNLGKEISVSSPYVKIADSLMSLSANVDKNFAQGIFVRDVNLKSNYINLNSIVPNLKFVPQNPNLKFTIVNGKSNIDIFTVAGIIASNVTSDFSLKNNILYLDDINCDAYFGKIGGNISYEILHRKTDIKLQGRNLNSNPALTALVGKNYDINGKLDFDSNISMTGFSKSEILRSLKGNTIFIITNGKMGVLGKFEHLLYAQNVLSNSIFKATLNVVVKAITVKNTGVYKYMKGKITFENGFAKIHTLKTSGPSMSLYITGRAYLPDNTANLIILGRISDDIVRILGPIGEFSMNKVFSSIPKIGEINTPFLNQITTNPDYENTSQIPPLTPQTEFKTKEFKVIIDGDFQKQSSVKSFKWLSKPRAIPTNQQQNIIEPNTNTVPDFVKNLPDLGK